MIFIMIDGLIAITYKDLWNDYDIVEPLVLLKNIPTIGILDFIVERQNEVLFAFSDIEAHKKRLFEMRCYLDENAKHRFDSLISKHNAISLFCCESNNLMYKLVLQEANTLDRPLQSNDILNIYKAYLYCTQKWSDIPLNNQDLADIDSLFLRVDLPIVEFKLYKDFRPQLLKAHHFFTFCEKDPLFKEFLQWFYKDKKISNWQEYINRLFCLLTNSLESRWIILDNFHIKDKEFFNQYCINIEDCSNLWNNDDHYYLRNHFLYNPTDGLYLLLNFNLMVDKFYQGMKFDFCESVLSRNGKDENGKTIKNIPNFNSLLGRKFSESVIFYDMMHKCFDGNFDIVISGSELKPYFENEGEPDFYIRKGKSAFIFEYKDLTLGNDVKYSSNTELIKQEIIKRICKGGTKQRKGAGQLLHCINSIINENRLSEVDKQASKIDIFFPIVITTDRAFSALGINKFIINEFANIANEYNLNSTHIAPVVIIDYDTLFILSYRLHNQELDLQKLLTEYTSLLLNSPGGIDFNISFYTYVYDKYRIDKIEKEEYQYLFGDLFDKF